MDSALWTSTGLVSSSSFSSLPSSAASSSSVYQPRITNACDFCKRLHIKCDGKAVCSNCIKRELVCVYSASKRRLAKGKRLKIDCGTSAAIVPSGDDLHSITLSVNQFIHTLGPDPFYSWVREIPSFDLVRVSNSELSTSKLVQKFILFGIAAIGTIFDQKFELGNIYYRKAKEIFTKLFGYCSTDFVRGILLLEEYCFMTGKHDECLCYPGISNQLLSSIYATSPPDEDLNTLFCQVLAHVAVVTLDREDRYHYYTKGRKIVCKPADILLLSALFCHGEVTQQIRADENWDLDMICGILDESEQLSQTSNMPEPFSLYITLLIWAHRAAAYWKTGNTELSLIWSTKVTELSFDMRINYHHSTVMVAMGLITKLHIQGKHFYNLEQNLKILSILKEYFPFISDLIQEVREALNIMNNHQAVIRREEGKAQGTYNTIFDVPGLFLTLENQE